MPIPSLGRLEALAELAGSLGATVAAAPACLVRERPALSVRFDMHEAMLRPERARPPIAQLAEAADLKSAQSGFESQWGDFD